jgi:hypothetical protein
MCAQSDRNDSEKPVVGMPAPLGFIEPHSGMLTVPADGQLLFKVMKVEDLLRSVSSNYLYFNRVDLYADFPDADKHDGEQLPMERCASYSTHHGPRCGALPVLVGDINALPKRARVCCSTNR